jgi:hypothetical protein
MYMSDLRLIPDPVLSSLKMEGILLRPRTVGARGGAID